MLITIGSHASLSLLPHQANGRGLIGEGLISDQHWKSENVSLFIRSVLVV